MRSSKTLYASAIALGLCLAVPPAVFAAQGQNQQDDQRGNRHNQHNNNQNDNDNDRDRGDNRDNDNNRDRGDNNADNDRHGNNNDNDSTHRNVNRDVTVHRNVHIDKNVRDRIMHRPDVVKIRANIRAPKRFHWNVYVRPSGWYAHRWVYNEVLPRAFFANTYWITDYGQFGLVLPPPGFVWVRVGDDALLIDRDTGLVVRVVYDVFY